MSKNRNRAKLKKAHDNREYSIIQRSENIYCFICARRAGNMYGLNCHPSYWIKKGWKGRRYMTWKHNRKTQWKNY